MTRRQANLHFRGSLSLDFEDSVAGGEAGEGEEDDAGSGADGGGAADAGAGSDAEDRAGSEDAGAERDSARSSPRELLSAFER
jgi:hypothetical protein